MNQNETPSNEGFEQFGLSEPVIKGLTEAGFKIPSPIQKEAIPLVLQGRDMIAQAQTGTGKTAAFGLPAMSRIKRSGGTEVLVITPTRELASQVSDELFRLGRYAGIHTLAVYGGQSIRRQVELLTRGAEVVVATPGRLLDHLRSSRLGNFQPSLVVLDEADEMLDMGFIEDIEEIFKFLPKERQTLLFSATMPPAIQKLAQRILKDPVVVKTTPVGETTSRDITQQYYVIQEHERVDAIVRLMDSEEPEKAIIFCRTKKEADVLSNTLISIGYPARALHGDMEQKQREIAINAFKKGEVETLVATDVAARGLDVTGISHVFNYHMPFDAESYVHRIGRTGRAGQKGVAITLVTPMEYRALKRIRDVTGASMVHQEVPTIKQLEELNEKKIIQTIMDQPVRDQAKRILATLLEQDDQEKVLLKIVSSLLDSNEIMGPDRIGMRSDQVQSLDSRSSDYGRGRYRNQERGGGSRGGPRKYPARSGYRQSGGGGHGQGSGSGHGGKGGKKGY